MTSWSVGGLGPERGRSRGRRGAVIGAASGVLSLAVTIGALVAFPGVGGAKSTTTTTISRSVTQKARAALLKQSDLPAGWTTSAPASGPIHGSPLSKPLVSCIGASKGLAALKPVQVSSPNFTSSDKKYAVEDIVSSFATAAQAKAVAKTLADAKTPGCMNSIGSAALQQSIQREAGSGATVGTITISPFPAGSLSKGQSGFIVSIPISTGGQTLTITSAQIDFAKGKLSQQLTFNGNGSAFPSLLELHLIKTAAARL
jgi:hypothetical protein